MVALMLFRFKSSKASSPLPPPMSKIPLPLAITSLPKVSIRNLRDISSHSMLHTWNSAAHHEEVSKDVNMKDLSKVLHRREVGKEAQNVCLGSS